ncbi:hypothetical protein OTU49_003272 [Cherax quadricarinatus]|uniref:C2H2-type domain-containing protein n=1 Tax=Cherax quadricarinatus TaxID=27406 RepID=A0AAW0X5Y3_CHEQU|nr:zinc finger protein 394-like [Cherax quadricarinatus]
MEEMKESAKLHKASISVSISGKELEIKEILERQKLIPRKTNKRGKKCLSLEDSKCSHNTGHKVDKYTKEDISSRLKDATKNDIKESDNNGKRPVVKERKECANEHQNSTFASISQPDQMMQMLKRQEQRLKKTRHVQSDCKKKTYVIPEDNKCNPNTVHIVDKNKKIDISSVSNDSNNTVVSDTIINNRRGSDNSAGSSTWQRGSQWSGQTRYYGGHTITIRSSNKITTAPSIIVKNCSCCGKRFLNNINENNKALCIICEHDVHEEGIYFCHHCDLNFDDESDLLRHWELHLDIPVWRCFRCKRRFLDEGKLKNHCCLTPSKPEDEKNKQDFFAFFSHEFRNQE